VTPGNVLIVSYGAMDQVQVEDFLSNTKAFLHPWPKEEVSPILAVLPDGAPVPAELNRLWRKVRGGRNRRPSPPRPRHRCRA